MKKEEIEEKISKIIDLAIPKNAELGIFKVKKYPRFTLYQVCRKVNNVYEPIYKTTLEKGELSKYVMLED